MICIYFSELRTRTEDLPARQLALLDAVRHSRLRYVRPPPQAVLLHALCHYRR